MNHSNEIAVSVAVITYNMEGYLKQLLDSILMQKTDFRYEIVVDDDHSPDHTREILLDYKDRYPGQVCSCLFGNRMWAAAEICMVY